jgi:hypothetical protein
MFKDSSVWIHPTTTLLADSAYQGIGKIHSNSQIPIKRKNKPELATVDKKYNRQLASVRCPIEQVNRRCVVRFFEWSRKSIEANISIIRKRGI